MKLKIKIAITITLVIIVGPLIHYLYVVWNQPETFETKTLIKYIPFILIDWIIFIPILLKLLNNAAKMCAKKFDNEKFNS